MFLKISKPGQASTSKSEALNSELLLLTEGRGGCQGRAASLFPDPKHVNPGRPLLPEVAWDRRPDHGGVCSMGGVGLLGKWPQMHA